jgi:putative ABC transport system substrate-binding protein
MMDRRRFLLASLAGVIPAPLTAWGQERGKIWRIGFLHPGRPKPSPEEMARNAFFVALQELGWGEGQNVLYEWRSAEGQLQLFPSLASELVTAKVDLIHATSSPATRAAKQATATIPIVFTEVGQPVRQGLVLSLSRPGGNLTGFADVSLELMPKRLELLKQLVPRAVRVAVLVTPEPQWVQMALPDTQRAARALGLQLETFEVSPATDLDVTFARIRQSRADALTIIPEALFFVLRARIAELAIANRLPFIAEIPLQAEAGATLIYNYNTRHMYRLAARYIDQILKGTKPADLPVQEPSRFELIINRKTARAIGLSVPQSLLDRADRVIE